MTTKKTKLDTLETSTGKTPSKKVSGRKAPVKKEAKLDSLSFADGKQEEEIRKARELEELVGLNQVNPFGTSLTPIFEEKLKEMTLVDLQELAVSVGVFPSGTKTSLKNKLQKAFRDHQRGSASFVTPGSAKVCEGVDQDGEAFKRAIKLMKEGL